jgi:hypothetical protein
MEAYELLAAAEALDPVDPFNIVWVHAVLFTEGQLDASKSSVSM